ncbi:FAD-dependent oxidoreductase [Candidatus Parcubacteria bacterium]|nr:FAD-dependent oxidoreductase [Candidatus Parcubacteria bacterium]
MTKKQYKIVIIGGGPTGIGAAYHLNKLGHTNWVLYEKHDYVGGHSSSHLDDKGFLWDEGGHVLFSHFKYYDQFVKESLGKNFYTHQRECWIKLTNGWVPYPFQNNIQRLPAPEQLQCLLDLMDAQQTHKPSKNFKEWILNTFGKGIADTFLIPYNFSVWATPATKMAYHWIGERVSVVDINRILKNIIKKEDDISWGPNNTFIFPKFGGTRGIYEPLAKKLKNHIKLNKEITNINFKKKIITFKDGSSDTYDHLISAVPIDVLIKNSDAPEVIKKNAAGLVFNSIIIIGIGIEKKIETPKCWVYFPDPEVPFYRLTYFHNYSPYLVPDGDTNKYSSLMCEVSYSKFKKINKDTILEQTIAALIKNGIINEADRGKVVSKKLFDIKYGYPIPTLDRDAKLNKIQAYLLGNKVYSRGRYGAWKYEISNMDHCFMQGVEAVDKIIKNKKETVWS